MPIKRMSESGDPKREAKRDYERSAATHKSARDVATEIKYYESTGVQKDPSKTPANPQRKTDRDALKKFGSPGTTEKQRQMETLAQDVFSRTGKQANPSELERLWKQKYGKKKIKSIQDIRDAEKALD